METVETKEERKRRQARMRQQRRRQRLQGEKMMRLGRCPVCTSLFLIHESQGTPKRFCSRRCIDRNRYLNKKWMGGGARTMLLAHRLTTGGATDEMRRLFGSVGAGTKVIVAGGSEQEQKAATDAWIQQSIEWEQCQDMTADERLEHIKRLWAQERGITA